MAIHWACSYNHFPIVELLVSRKDFDPDVQDGSGWTPLMIASSLPEGDALVDLLLSKEADVNAKSTAPPGCSEGKGVVTLTTGGLQRLQRSGQIF